MIRVTRTVTGPRVYVVGRRCHHGTAGCIAVAGAMAAAKRWPWVAGALAVGGGLAIAHDLTDFPWTDNHNH